MRIANLVTLRAVCRAHPLWHRRFAQQWVKLRTTADHACIATTVEPDRQLLGLSFEDEGQVVKIGQKLSQTLRLPPQAFVWR